MSQVLVASEDDASPLLQIWDLRNAFAPVKELSGHHKGILSASWCPNDASLLLSSAKDNRTLCWDPESGEILCELRASPNWTFDVQWSPRIPAILSACSFGSSTAPGQIGVYSLADSSIEQSTPASNGWEGVAQQQAPRSMKAPKWLQRPCGAVFGFGGKIAMFGPPAPGAAPTVTVTDVVTDEGIVARATALQGALESQDLAGFCERKAAAAPTERDRTEWELMQVLARTQ